MSEWNGMTFEAKDTMLRVVRAQAEGMFAMAASPSAWETQTASAEWQVRDIIGHIVDVTEGYFEAFDTARSNGEAGDAYGVTGMAARANEQAQAFRTVPQQELLPRLQTDFDKMMGIFEGLSEDDWTNLLVPHFYMGSLPSFFYPAFQLMDYGVHSWDIRQGLGREHGLDGETADLLVPFMFVLWQATAATQDTSDAFQVGIKITSGANAGDTVLSVAPEGVSADAGSVDALPVVFEFDPASFVLTVFGRANAGTYRGDPALADRFLNLFFRI
jgi:uncharacterized protein (TIGR03083 family)